MCSKGKYIKIDDKNQDTRLDEKNEKWDSKKFNNETVFEAIKQIVDNEKNQIKKKKISKLLRLEECAFWLEYKKLKIKDNEGQIRLLNRASFCRVRHCPICQWRRSMKIRAKMFNRVLPYLEENKDIRLIFLTLTIENCRSWEIRKTIKEMNKAWGKFRRTRKFERTFKGYIKTTEITRNSKNNTAHPHFHVILATNETYFKKVRERTDKDNYYTQKEFTNLWKKSLQVLYDPVIDVKAIKKEETTKSFLETTKYMTKSADLIKDLSFFSDYILETDKLRFFSTGGIFKELLKDIEDDQDLVNIDDEKQEIDDDSVDYIEMFNYNQTKKYYTRTYIKKLVEE